MDDASLARIGELLDQVMTIDIKGRGAVAQLYAAVRKKVEGPLSLKAATTLANAAGNGECVVLVTGFPVRPWISAKIGETDGPPGVAALARALSMGFNTVPIVAAPAAMLHQVSGALTASGVGVLEPKEVRSAIRGPRPTCAAAVVAYTTESEGAAAAAKAFFDEYNPCAVMAVEHPGANAKGVYHSSVGLDISEGTAKIEPLFALAQEHDVPTLSFIDMANEIGSGACLEVAHATLPFARECVCPCQSGMASVSEVDHVVVGTTANWAAQATVAAFSILEDKPSLAFSRERDVRAIAAVQQGGGVEGVSGSIWPDAGVDGIPTKLCGHITDFLAAIVANADHYRNGKPF